jgi:hypothetical protein
MAVVRRSSKLPKGRSFTVSELILIANWSAANGLRMAVRLDHGSDTEEYEEVVAFHLGDSRPCRWIMWRSDRAVFVQPLIGRRQRYGSVAAAFEAMVARRRVVLTDIEPKRCDRRSGAGLGSSETSADQQRHDGFPHYKFPPAGVV